LLIKEVRAKFPTHAVRGEEEEYTGQGCEYLWSCDPVDGTAQFARGVGVSVFSLALVIDGEPVVGVVLDPFTNSLYWAAKGKGAYKNGERIYVSKTNFGDEGSMSNYCGVPNLSTAVFNIYDAIVELRQNGYFVNIGSCVRACMAVAEGAYNLQLFPNTTAHDVASAKIIVTEAGGIVTDLFGEKQRYDRDIKGAIVCNKVVFKQVLDCVKKNLNQ